MSGRLRGIALACAAALAALPAGRLRAADPPADEVFGLTRVWEFGLTIPAKEYEAMQPAGGMPGFPGAPAPPRPKAPPGEEPRETHKGGSFGMEYPWARGDLTAEGRTYKDVGLRYKGGGSYMASMGRLRRNIKVDLDRHREGQRFHGLKALNLNAGAMDPSRLREAIAYAVYRDAGVPAPRTAFAEVTLTVPGKYDRELAGLYTLVEQVDKAFLKAHFKSGDGLLLKPEVRPGAPGRGALSYRGEDWAPYRAALGPKRDATKAEAARFIAFTKLIDRADDEQFRKEVGGYLDVDAFLRFLAVTALLANTDSFFFGGHNAYLYLDPKTKKFALIPWDLDLSFGGFFMFGQPDQQADMSLTHPFPGEHRLVDRLLAIGEVRERYFKVVRELMTTAFAKDRLTATIDAVERAVREPLARERKAGEARREPAGGFGPPGFAPAPDLRRFVQKRAESVAAQLDGKSKGTIPAMNFGPGPGGPRPRPGEILPPPVQDALRLTPEQRKRLAEMQKKLDAELDGLLTEEQRAIFKRMRAGGPGGRPPGGPPTGRQP